MNVDAMLGNRIKNIRTAKRRSAEQVAKFLGISEQRYADVENGLVRVTLDVLEKTSKALGTTVGEIAEALNDESDVTFCVEEGGAD